MEIGKNIRKERIIDRNSRRTVIVPLDHGISVGPIKGLVDFSETVQKVAEGGANAVLMQKGMIPHGHRGYGKDVGLITHLSASTSLGPNPNNKIQVCEVEEALKYGVDGVSVHVNVGSKTETQQLRKLGKVAEKCDQWGVPLIAMMYPRGDKIKDEYDLKYVKHAARAGAELGADIIKTNYTGSSKTFSKVVEGCPVPIVVAGGPKMENEKEVLEMVEGAIKGGASGVAIGRNVFQSKNVPAMTNAISQIVHKDKKAEEAYRELKN
ncbi:2-amino-37-dideoxy-D-threo-hept-6-ulosonic acid synthase DhnA-aldolase family [Methanonatronarchaeum thermophilum]|uniref:2-amino-3,7-dideoxy-D-threo-hept-6-ulosonate synthase n=1 Tax=Methanonatronarchaeum thermophilum TaxID=1927129 RepID=A0A1Y3GAQ2_9EURY|nr:2-amino-3,7-dideoxy-D-threo-hept-6-ulosonate synthase [Methanonatronarchaeum thermophilum]OUJ18337.1 2-amino-37-dideoxy-D-threo-hept-6-ulosonic acid synthase DhnA-aldolase family [Methanonatronarchaeum thermophilum]